MMLLSALVLLLVIGGPLLYAADVLVKPIMRHAMLAGTVLWFAAVSFWMGRRDKRE